jgi:hypothetical protein
MLGLAATACRSSGGIGAILTSGPRPPEINHVVAIYNKNPWLNADRAGDPDPEAVKFKVFLYRSKADRHAVIRDGTFHIEMYRVDRRGGREVNRELVADYHYPTSQVQRIPDPGKMGPGFGIGLVFPTKDISGQEITIAVTFEDQHGNKVRGEPKALMVPKRT